MKRTSKRYVVTSDALNCYGFRVITSGGDISNYANNPILLWMHNRATGNTTNQILPLGNGIELVFEGSDDATKLWCYLQFDDTDPFALQIANKYENGTLNMLSLGAKPLEWSDDPADMVPGQTGPTVTKWELVEISCVDIGGNPDAFGVQLYDADDNKINMADFTGESFVKLFNPLQKITKTENTDNMKLIELKGPALTGILLALKLKEDATEADVQKEVADLVQNNITLAGELSTLKSAKQTADDELAELKKTANQAKIIKLADDHKNKYLPGQRENIIALATANYESTEAYLNGLPVLKSIQEQIHLHNGNDKDAAEVAELIKLSYDDLWREGKLERLQKLDNQAFLDKRAEKFPVATSKK